jgi:CxxC motif-containing protein (DUF1111 family)
MKQNYNLFKNIFIIKSLVVIFATGLFAVDNSDKYLSNDKNNSILLKPINNLNDEQYDKFILGRSFFTIPWVESPSVTTARDGLGPLFNANTCISCHPSNGRGTLINKDGFSSRSLVARLSIKSNESKEHQELLKYKGFVPSSVYGNQLSINGIHGIDFEGNIKIDFEEVEVIFPDGEKQLLLKPKYSLVNLKLWRIRKR